jgi:hypothetical protein
VLLSAAAAVPVVAFFPDTIWCPCVWCLEVRGTCHDCLAALPCSQLYSREHHGQLYENACFVVHFCTLFMLLHFGGHAAQTISN